VARKVLDESTKQRGAAFSRRVREERERLGLTQDELAKHAKVSLDTLRSVEQAKILVPGVFLAADIVKALEGDLDTWVSDEQHGRAGPSGRKRRR
jgi:transcriptional regulator with XRE-family HTH domain